ncbi:MAG: hypothetical protein KatS3mg102_0951 [Planctomycetota bacterium]|nr:MAG: hypothetical protein KatS3mg102_0951 [Planctomycetota bacterium]
MVLVPVVLAAALGAHRGLFAARTLIYALLPLAALAGVGAAHAAGLGRAGPPLVLAALLASAAPGLVFVLGQEEHEDWRGAAALIRARAGPSDLVLAHEGFCDVNLVYHFRHWPQAPPVLAVEQPGVEGSALPVEQAVARALGSPQVWVIGAGYPGRRRDALPQALAARGYAAAVHELRFVRVVQLRRRGTTG